MGWLVFLATIARRPCLRLTYNFEVQTTYSLALLFLTKPSARVQSSTAGDGVIMAEDKPMTVKERMAALALASSGGKSGT